jgi:glucosamine-phosphate N-acetyltransferase
MEIIEYCNQYIPQEDINGLLETLKENYSINEITEDSLIDYFNNDNHLFIVKEGDEVIGTLTLHLQKKLIRDGSIAGFIEDVLIKEKYRGKGIGKKLIDIAIKAAKELGCYKINLSCYENRINFYEKCGFHIENNTMRYNIK